MRKAHASSRGTRRWRSAFTGGYSRRGTVAVQSPASSGAGRSRILSRCLLFGRFHLLRKLEFRACRVELNVVFEVVGRRQRLSTNRGLTACQQRAGGESSSEAQGDSKTRYGCLHGSRLQTAELADRVSDGPMWSSSTERTRSDCQNRCNRYRNQVSGQRQQEKSAKTAEQVRA